MCCRSRARQDCSARWPRTASPRHASCPVAASSQGALRGSYAAGRAASAAGRYRGMPQGPWLLGLTAHLRTVASAAWRCSLGCAHCSAAVLMATSSGGLRRWGIRLATASENCAIRMEDVARLWHDAVALWRCGLGSSERCSRYCSSSVCGCLQVGCVQGRAGGAAAGHPAAGGQQPRGRRAAPCHRVPGLQARQQYLHGRWVCAEPCMLSLRAAAPLCMASQREGMQACSSSTARSACHGST